MKPRRRAFPFTLLLASPLVAACGASTIKLSVAPVIDERGGVGVEGALSLGLGMPLDFNHRSHHYLQILGTGGGGLDTRNADPMAIARAELEYINWALPHLDVRAGAGYVFHDVFTSRTDEIQHGFGGHLTLLPVVAGSNDNWLVMHFSVGPELRVEYLFGPGGGARFSLPLVLELDFLAAGD